MPQNKPALKAVFGMPPAEAVRYLERKKHLPSAGFETVSAAEHQTSLTAAQTAGFNVLGDIFDALRVAQDAGLTPKQFQERLEPVLRAKGWWGKAVDSSTGEILKMYPGTSRPVRYGSPARLRLIYDTNMASSYGAGRRERQLAVVDAFPFLRYTAVMDRRTRMAHRALNGQVFPANHPFWEIHYPPNGYRCRCVAQALTRAQVASEGIRINEGGSALEKYVRVNANGDVMRVRGWRTQDGREFFADPGFDVPPGGVEQSLKQLSTAFERLPQPASMSAANALARGEAFAAWRANPVGNFPIALLPAMDASKIGSKKRSAQISPETLAKQEREHPELSNEEYALIQRTINDGVKHQDSEQSLIYIFDDKMTDGQVVIVKTTRSGEGLFVTSMRRLSGQQAKKDSEIRRLLKK